MGSQESSALVSSLDAALSVAMSGPSQVYAASASSCESDGDREAQALPDGLRDLPERHALVADAVQDRPGGRAFSRASTNSRAASEPVDGGPARVADVAREPRRPRRRDVGGDEPGVARAVDGRRQPQHRRADPGLREVQDPAGGVRAPTDRRRRRGRPARCRAAPGPARAPRTPARTGDRSRPAPRAMASTASRSAAAASAKPPEKATSCLKRQMQHPSEAAAASRSVPRSSRVPRTTCALASPSASAEASGAGEPDDLVPRRQQFRHRGRPDPPGRPRHEHHAMMTYPLSMS